MLLTWLIEVSKCEHVILAFGRGKDLDDVSVLFHLLRQAAMTPICQLLLKLCHFVDNEFDGDIGEVPFEISSLNNPHEQLQLLQLLRFEVDSVQFRFFSRLYFNNTTAAKHTIIE